jgi:hypothetical protein
MNKFAVLLVAVVFSNLSGFGQNVVPIVELHFGGLMGGVQNGKWVAPTKFSSKLKAESEFVLVGFSGVEEGGVTLGKKGEKEDVCDDFTRYDFELKQNIGVAIGSSARWKPVPRIPKSIDINSSIYMSVVASFLKKKGIARPVVKITEAFRIDLEGDGTEEVAIAATYYKGGLTSAAKRGDYSVILLRKAIGKTVTDFPLAGSFILKNIDFGAPEEYHISSIADLNGDGKMEIVYYGFYYEGDFAGAYEMRNGKPVMIKEFEIGCGV